VTVDFPARPAAARTVFASATAAWLIDHGGRALDMAGLIEGFAARLIEDGIPVQRLSCASLTVHPQIRGRNVVWTRGHATLARTRGHELEHSAVFRDSPFAALVAGAPGLRRRLEGLAPQLDYPILAEVRDAGATDYVILPVRFASGAVNYVSWTTDRAGGFTDPDIWFLADLVPLLALRLEIEAARFEGGVLLATYLGAEAARRVLAGDIRRGEGRTIRAALWYSDMRGFTALAARTDVVVVLNRYFECAVGAVENEGGEISKFIGDAVLAIFPAAADAATACAAALRAAYDADRRLAAFNESQQAAGQAPLAHTIALHLGDVTFGNIGGPDRLDFTVTGAAVNELARLEELAPTLGETIVASGAFAAACSGALHARGRHRLRGVAEPLEVFAAAR